MVNKRAIRILLECILVQTSSHLYRIWDEFMRNQLKYTSNILINSNCTGIFAPVIDGLFLELSQFKYGTTQPVKDIVMMLLFPPYAFVAGLRRLLSFYSSCLISQLCSVDSDIGKYYYLCGIVEMFK